MYFLGPFFSFVFNMKLWEGFHWATHYIYRRKTLANNDNTETGLGNFYISFRYSHESIVVRL